jgi:hypothetical protein
MKKIIYLAVFGTLFYLAGCKQGQKSETAADTTSMSMAQPEQMYNVLTDSEKTDGWQLLFDGKTSEGWRGYLKDSFPSGWEAADGALHCKGSGMGEAGAANGGDILYNKKFKDFDLKLDWKISKGGNSGIFILGQEDKKFAHIYETAPEMQVLDNVNHPDARLGKDGNRMAGSLYDLIPAKPQNAKPYDEWNSVEIICYQGSVIYYQNGEKVLEYHLWTPEWNKLVAGSKFPALNPDWAKVAHEGYIALQDHGNDVWFRNIKIKVMD